MDTLTEAHALKVGAVITTCLTQSRAGLSVPLLASDSARQKCQRKLRDNTEPRFERCCRYSSCRTAGGAASTVRRTTRVRGSGREQRAAGAPPMAAGPGRAEPSALGPLPEPPPGESDRGQHGLAAQVARATGGLGGWLGQAGGRWKRRCPRLVLGAAVGRCWSVHKGAGQS